MQCNKCKKARNILLLLSSLLLLLSSHQKRHLRKSAPKPRAGPEVRGCRPVLVNFESFKDRETVLRQAKLLKKQAGIDVTEDLSRFGGKHF